MSTRRKLFYTLLIPAMIALFAILVVLAISRNQEKMLKSHTTVQLQESVNQVVALYESQVFGIVDDYTYWDDMYNFVKMPDTTWARNNISTILSSFDMDALWVLNADRQVIFDDFKQDSLYLVHHLVSLQFMKDMLDQLHRERFISFYVKADDHVTFIQGATIHRTNDHDRLREPAGYFFIGKCWYEEQLESINTLTGSDTRFVDSTPGTDEKSALQEVSVIKPLFGWDGNVITYVVFTRQLDFLLLMRKTTSQVFILLIITTIVTVMLFSYMLRNFFTRPLAIASDIIKTNDTSKLGVLKSNTKDFRRIGTLIEDFIAQKELLLQEKAKAEVADQHKSAFLANMSHEIRTPLNGVLGFAELLKSQSLNEAQRDKYVDIILSSGNHLLGLMNDIIDLSKIEAGYMRLMEEKFPVTVMFRELLMFFEENSFVRQKGLILLIDHDLDENLIMCGDRMRLRQVMINLLNNAAKFTEKGGITFGARMLKPDVVTFYVSDTGPGIDDNLRTVIFDRFNTLESQTKHIADGAGLGLSISRGLVQMMGGSIWAEPNEGGGSVFFFTVPLRQPDK